MLAIGVNHKWDACPSKGSTQAPVHPHIKLSKYRTSNHVSVMKTRLTIIPMCPRELFSHYKKLFRLVFCYKKDFATFLHLIYFHSLLLFTIYLITKLSITYNFSACRENLTENRLSFPSAPRWVRHSYLSKGLRLIPYTCGLSLHYTSSNCFSRPKTK